MAPPVLAAAYFGHPYFMAIMLAGAAVIGWEWWTVTKGRLAWLPLGVVYAAIPCAALIWLRGDGDAGRLSLFWLFAVVWSADTGAYLFGRAIGGPKLAPRISPKKTWAGFIGGIAFAGAVGEGFAAFMGAPLIAWGIAGAVVSVVSQLGDLAESAWKRHFGVKDSSGLIPGHGGLLDRVDGLVAGAVALALLQSLLGATVLSWP